MISLYRNWIFTPNVGGNYEYWPGNTLNEQTETRYVVYYIVHVNKLHLLTYGVKLKVVRTAK